jgi:hypothetical protein
MNAMRMLVSERRMHLLVAAAVVALVAAIVLLVSPISGATAASTSTLTTCQDNNSTCATYPFGGWKKVLSGKASGGAYHVSKSATKAAVFRPTNGPEIDLVTATGPKRGTAKAFVFDVVTGEQVKVVKFNLRAERTHHKVVKRITGLPRDRTYAVAVISANGKPVVVDAFKGSPPADGSLAQPPEGVEPPGS